RSPAMQTLYAEILRAAASDASVLVTGESGVGKELVSRALHDNSPRSNGPYVPLHCASLPDTLLDSELFGHARGAFSGAGAARAGRFEAANGGTLLLDEIGEVSLPMQAKLLRVLQEREIVRLGENHVRRVDVRVIAATHRDLAAMVRRGEFREDLYYRLRVVPLRVPSLRERLDDIPLLASGLLARLAERYKRTSLRISADSMNALEAYDWPGNVRQLFNTLEFAAVQSEGLLIEPRHLLPEILEGERAPADAARGVTTARYYRSPGSADEERQRILEALESTRGNKAAAAQRLGMSRTTLWKKLR
ncbi:MAG: sigma-54-dependent Fis family transcriptional regulator, partial [Burkholderiales bacterium]|nr:sigma-54-dependent Fis family transcriptional regulator [Burkholderiales bacterium]